MGNSFKNISVVIVSYNSADVVGDALDSVKNFESIFVVDNNSSDNTSNLVKQNFPKVNFIQNDSNLGFGAANNIALEKIKTKYALLLNPDATIEEDDILKLLEAADTYSDAAIISPILVDEGGSSRQNYKRNVFNREKRRSKYIEPEGDLCAEYIPAAVWLLNMENMKKVGFFDPEIFLFYEDDDLCLRAREAGYSCVVVPAAKAVHKQGASSGGKGEGIKQQHMIKSRLYMERKYKGGSAVLSIKMFFSFFIKLALYSASLNRKKSARYFNRIVALMSYNLKS